MTLITDPTRAHSGNNYVQISVPANGAANVYSQSLAVQPGDQISYGGWAYMESGPGTSGNTGWWLETQDSNHNALSWFAASPAATTSSGWTFQSGSYTIPSGVAYVALYGLLYLPTVSTTLRVDDAFLYDNRTSLQIAQNLDFLPFGEQLNTPDSGVTTHEFTGDQHDSETNLDHTWFRKYSPTMARWLTPDPAGLAAVDPTNPQSWNRYAYVLNNPLRLVDPQGLDCIYYENEDETDFDIEPGDCVSDGDSGYYVDGTVTGTVTVGGQLTGVLLDGGDVSNPVGTFGQNTSPGSNYSDSWDLGALSNFSWWDLLRNPISGSIIVPVTSFGPAASAGLGPTVAYNPRTGTGCVVGAVGAMVPAGGRSAAVGPLTVGNLSNADDILAGLSVFAGAQSANPAVGVQVMGNSSGILASPTFGTEGLTSGVSYSWCTSNVGTKMLNWIINNLVK